MAGRELARAARALADQQSARLSDLPSTRAAIVTVATVTPGASPGGNARVTVTYRGRTVTAKSYDVSYTPVVGDRVWCLFLEDGQLLIGGKCAA